MKSIFDGDFLVGPLNSKTKERTPLTQGQKNKLLYRCQGRCEKCHKKLTHHDIHHKNEDPSDNRLSNLIVLCPECHAGITRSGKHPHQEREGRGGRGGCDNGFAGFRFTKPPTIP